MCVLTSCILTLHTSELRETKMNFIPIPPIIGGFISFCVATNHIWPRLPYC